MAVAVCAFGAGRVVAAPTANGLIVYGNAATTPQYEAYAVATNTFPNAAAAAGAAAAANPTYVVDRAAPGRNEHIAGYVTTGGVLYVIRWNGTSWSNEWNVTVGGAGANGRRFDIAYETTTGRAVVVYSNNVIAQLRYNIWNGTAWSYTTSTAPTLTSARLTAIPNWIKLTARNAASTNSIALAVADTASDLSALIWSGSAWGNEPAAALSTTLQLSTVAGDKDAFDVAYENQSGDLFLVYSETLPSNWYRTFTASTSTWSGALTLSATGRTIISMFAVADTDPASNRVVAGWDRTTSANRYGVTWDGTTLGTIGTIGTNGDATSPPTTSHQMTGAWLTSGASKRAVVVYQSTTVTNIDYAYFDVTAGTWTVTQASAGYTSGDKRWVDMEVDPRSPDTLMLTYSDLNSDLWAKRLVYNGSTLTWTNADGGAALTATLTNATTPCFSFAYDRYVPPAGNITLGNNSGTEAPNPPSAICAATGAATYIDYFTLLASAPTNVTGITTAFNSNPSGLLSLLEVTNDAGTQQGSLTNPSGLAPAVGGSMSFAAPTASALQYRLRITPNAATTTSGTFTATVTGVTNSAGLTLAGSDSTSASVIVDGAASPDVTAASASGGAGSVTASWTNPGAGTVPGTDFGSYVVVLGNTVAITGAPAKGTSSYTAGATIGADSVVCVGNITTCAKSGLGSSVTYYLKIFTRDGCANWSAGVSTSAITQATAVTTIANGVDPTVSATPVAPGSAAVAIDSFTVQKSAIATADNITAVEVTFDPGTAQGIALVEIMNDGLTGAPFGSFTNPADVQSFTLTTAIPSTTTLTQYKIRVTPRAHANMPIPPGGAYAVRARISDITVTYAKNVSPGDSSSSTLNVDNASAPDVSGASATGGTGSVTSSWTNPAAGTAPGTDFASYVVVLGNTVPVTNAPAEGTATYTQGGTIGADSIVCVVNPATPSGAGSCPKSGLTACQTYYMEIFTRDAMNNWSPGVAVSSTASCGANPGSTVAGTNLPVISIQNPGRLTRVTGAYRLQVFVYSPSAASSTQSDINSLNVTTNGSDPTCTASQLNGFTLNAGYTGKVGSKAWIYEASMPAASGTLYIKVCAGNPTGTVFSETVQVVAQTAGTGDGNLLSRDNSSQLCVDCHAVASHSSQSTSNQYGSWALACRDCHQPHNAKNADLVRSQITPPSYRGVKSPKTVVFYDKTTGDGGATAGGYVNDSRTGPCQVCHTQTKNQQTSAVRWQADVANTDTHYTAASGTSPCASCHSHANGFKASCTSCHGTPSRVSIAGADSLQPAAPPVTAPTAVVFVTGGGAHVKHVNGNGTQATLRTAPLQCTNCHPAVAGTHPGGTTDMQWTGLASSNGVTPAPAAGALASTWPTTPTCTNYCHGTTLTGGSNKTPNWTLGATQATCGTCHQVDNTGHYAGACNTCHGPGYQTTKWDVTAGITGVARDTHIDGLKEAPFAACPDCHNAIADDTTIPGTRRAITGEFTTTGNWSHKRNASPAGTVTKWDCIVCHMEGDVSTGAPSSVHKDGYVNLRDPDTGNEIQGVIWTNASGSNPGSFAPSGATLQTGTPLHNGFAQFSRNLTVALENDPSAPALEAIEVNHCLKCHDSNGANAYGTPGSPLATLATASGSGATAGKPFGTTIAAAQGKYAASDGYTACLGPPPAWDSTRRYEYGPWVSSASVYYKSINEVGNLNFVPPNATYWQPAAAWSSTTTYDSGDWVTYGGTSYRSLQSTNLNQTPGAATSSSWWQGLNAVDGCVTNVATSLATTNSSYHPILGKQNNSYAAGTRMASPWSMTKTAGTTTSWGFLMSCWDCHALPADGGTITKTVTAHGDSATVRGNAFAAGTCSGGFVSPVTLCIKCHAQYDTLSVSNHLTGSAFSAGGNGGMQTALRTACNGCHGGFWNGTTFQVRPRRAEDVHGFDALPPDGNLAYSPTNATVSRKTRWMGQATGAPATRNARPYGFIRNTYVLGQHSPKSAVVAGVTVTYTIGCSTPTTQAMSGCGSMSTYTVGGVY